MALRRGAGKFVRLDRTSVKFPPTDFTRITVEGHAKNGELSALQKAFIAHFAFKCGYCTAGFLNESQVLLERLAKKPVARAEVEKTIAEALDGHLCRCTGYIKYHEAVRAVILADPGRYLS